MDITRYYGKVFALPTVRKLLLVLCLEITVLMLGEYVIHGLQTAVLMFKVLMLAVPIFSGFAFLALHRSERIFTLARCIFLSLLTTGSTGIIDLVARKKFTIYPLMPSIYLSALTSQLITGGIGGWDLMVAIMQTPIVSLLSIILFNEPLDMGALLLSISLPLMASLVCMKSLELIGKDELNGMSLLKLSGAFAKMWLSNYKEELERALEQLSTMREVEVHYLKLMTDDGRLAGLMVVPEIHYGPFRDLGSSEMPALLVRTLREELSCQGIMVLHGAVTHREDLASSREMVRVVKEVMKKLLDHEESASKEFIGPVISEGEKFQVTGMVLGKTLLAFVTPRRGGIEDIPLTYWEYLKAKARGMGFSDAILVDEHNSIVDGEVMSFDELKKLIDDIVEQIKHGTREGIEAAIVNKRSGIEKELGVGEGGISVLYVKGLKSRNDMTIIVIDGNNMIRGFRDKVVRRIKEVLNVRSVEVLTTDTHSVSGLKPGGRGYLAIGEHEKHEELLKVIEEACIEARRKARRVNIRSGRIKLEKVMMYGDALSSIYKVIEEGYNRFVRLTFPLSTLCMMLIAMLFSCLT